MINARDCANERPTTPALVDSGQLRADVLALTSITPARNYLNTASLERAADFIKGRLTGLGHQAVEQPFLAYGHEYRNIIAAVGPRRAPRLVIGAHYDVFGDQPGADDNASGVAALLALAAIFTETAAPLACRIELAAFALEEPPAFGSERMGSFVHARSLTESGAPVLGMVSLESLGFYNDQPDTQFYPLPAMRFFYPSRGNFVAVVGNFDSRRWVGRFKHHMARGEIDVQQLVAPRGLTGVDFSDHVNYWRFGHQALMVTDTAFYRNPHYHQESDTVETLDFVRLGQVVHALALAVEGLCGGPRKGQSAD